MPHFEPSKTFECKWCVHNHFGVLHNFQIKPVFWDWKWWMEGDQECHGAQRNFHPVSGEEYSPSAGIRSKEDKNKDVGCLDHMTSWLPLIPWTYSMNLGTITHWLFSSEPPSQGRWSGFHLIPGDPHARICQPFQPYMKLQYLPREGKRAQKRSFCPTCCQYRLTNPRKGSATSPADLELLLDTVIICKVIAKCQFAHHIGAIIHQPCLQRIPSDPRYAKNCSITSLVGGYVCHLVVGSVLPYMSWQADGEKKPFVTWAE